MGNSFSPAEIEEIGKNLDGKNLKKIINVFFILFVILFSIKYLYL
jgi:hypothetical protein|tara:strand:- start:2731 stop:2865 length:135 start_codon:yes stop_codon:yes gene_type:complete